MSLSSTFSIRYRFDADAPANLPTFGSPAFTFPPIVARIARVYMRIYAYVCIIDARVWAISINFERSLNCFSAEAGE